jgi:carbamoyl-phosphate synthase/aspartate carbamoyltransferase/dihydroorotase
LETALPLLLTAVSERRLSIEDVIVRMFTNPGRIFNLPEQPDSWIDVDLNTTWELRASEMCTRCAWTPFEGWKVRGKVRRVFLRGSEAYRDGETIAPLGYGKNIRDDALSGAGLRL